MKCGCSSKATRISVASQSPQHSPKAHSWCVIELNLLSFLAHFELRVVCVRCVSHVLGTVTIRTGLFWLLFNDLLFIWTLICFVFNNSFACHVSNTFACLDKWMPTFCYHSMCIILILKMIFHDYTNEMHPSTTFNLTELTEKGTYIL